MILNRFWNNLELESKIILLAITLFALLVLPMQYFSAISIRQMASLSVDKDLGHVLLNAVNTSNGNEKKEAIQSLERYRQWRAAAPLVVKEQKLIGVTFSLILIIALIIIYSLTLKKLTTPLKKLSTAALAIGRNEEPIIEVTSSGAIGALESAMHNMTQEIKSHRLQIISEGMENAWRDIARVMAHEIKNPLTPIRLSIDRLDEKAALNLPISPIEWSKFSFRINSQLEQLERLVSSFSSFAKEPEVRSKQIDISQTLLNITTGFIGKLQIEITGSSSVYADPLLFQQISLNLLKNAVEANATMVDISIVDNGKSTSIFFHDNGIGLQGEDPNKIFLPYITNKPGGTGLGLAVVKKLTESMGGKISLPISSKSGLILCVELPSA